MQRMLLIAAVLGLIYATDQLHAQSNPWQQVLMPLPEGSESPTLVFNDRMWVIGADGYALRSDVWSSADGSNWVQETAAAAWPERVLGATAVFNGRMWILGGARGGHTGNRLNDVWSSADGINWRLERKHAPWSARWGHTATVFNGRLWVIGGRDGGGNLDYRSDVWSTGNGRHWRRESEAPWEPRAQHATVAFQDRLWVFGGQEQLNQFSDVWSTADGTTWIQETVSAPWQRKYGKAAVVFDDRLWMLGGVRAGQRTSEVWSSANGVDWTLELPAAPWTERTNHGAVVFNDLLWVVGGMHVGVSRNEVWSTPDGHNWAPATGPHWRPRGGASALEFDGRLWLLGSSNASDVWSSTDGVHWTMETEAAPWIGHMSNSFFAFNGRIWLFPGSGAVWSTADGANWTQELAEVPWNDRSHNLIVGFDDRVWVFRDSVPYHSYDRLDVWSSPDGVQWTLETPAAPWRVAAGAVALNNRLWVIEGNIHNLIWFSDDGINWTLAPVTPSYGHRHAHGVAVFNNRVWVLGGWAHGEMYNDVWSTDDMLKWRQETESAEWVPRGNFAIATFNDRLWVLGGIGWNQFNAFGHPEVFNDVWSLHPGSLSVDGGRSPSTEQSRDKSPTSSPCWSGRTTCRGTLRPRRRAGSRCH
jgi:N-acetylneuraminic acid mutarotase